jgi:hypothetical protein
VAQSADQVMTQIVRETYPGILDADIPQAMTQIDQSDPRIPARIFGGAFYGSELTSESSVNTYHCRGTGRAGDGILKDTPGFQKKGASTSSQVAHLSSQLEQTTFRLQRMAERMHQYERDMAEYHRAMGEWEQAVADVHDRNAAAQRQWIRDFMQASAQGLPPPPEPEAERQPQRPTPPVRPQQQDPQQEGDQQQQPDDGPYPQQDPQQQEDPQQQPDDGPYPQQDPQQHEGEEQLQPDENEMVDLGLDDWHY